jgi:hypothetical protein
MTRSESKKHKTSVVKGAPTDTTGLSDDLLTAIDDAISTTEPPSESMVQRCRAVPLLYHKPPMASSRTGRVSYDSWAHGEPISLRDVVDGQVRRMRLRAGRHVVEMVAERRGRQWEFTARVYVAGRVAHDFVLAAGRHKLLAETGGFFQWLSESVPHRIRLLSRTQSLEFETLSW